MPTFDYARAAATAARLIERFGFDARLRFPGVPTGPDHNPTPGAPTILPVVVCRAKLKFNEADGQRIKLTDLKLLLSPEGVTTQPSTDAEIDLTGADKWQKITAVEPVNPGDVDVYWRIYAR